MPTTLVIFYQEEDGSVPVLEWLDNLPEKTQDKCRVRIERLADLGHELRRPEADFLTDKIYELRVSLQGTRAMTQNRTTSDALTIMHRRYYQGNPERIAALEEARVNDEVARKITLLRDEEGLSQLELAELVGVAVSVICRLEDADYEGQSLAMLWRIAAALHRRVKIDLVSISHDLSEESLPPVL